MNDGILVAGIGNVFMGDDAFGVEVSRELAKRGDLPDGVRVMDVGIRGLDLTFALLDEYRAAILVDAVRRGGAPGTLYVLEPDPEELDDNDGGTVGALDTHGMDPVRVLRLVRAMGGALRCLRIVGCEPERWGRNGMEGGLSECVQAAVQPAVGLIVDLLHELQPKAMRNA